LSSTRTRTPRFAGLGRQALGEAAVAGLVDFHPGESQIVLPRLLARAAGSTWPSWTATTDSTPCSWTRITWGGCCVRAGSCSPGDYQLAGVARAASFFTANLGWGVEETGSADRRHHWAVLHTGTGPDTRPFGYLASF